MIYHSISLMFEGKLFFAPVKNPQRIADMATGTGIWAMDVGDQYKAAEGPRTLFTLSSTSGPY